MGCRARVLERSSDALRTFVKGDASGRVMCCEWSYKVDHLGGPPLLTRCVGGFIWISWCLPLDVGTGTNSRGSRGE